jgi:iron complex transport system ATP-binding protein
MGLTVTLQGLAIARAGRRLAQDLTLSFAPGSTTVLAGPNGVGKSTLLDCLAGELAPAEGHLFYNGQSVAAIGLAKRAAVRTLLRQQSDIAFDFPVADIVAMGLTPHGFSAASAAGASEVARALADLDLLPLARRPATRLSGGEAQRVHLARALVQLRAGMASGSGGLLLLDEPTTGLDYRHQLALRRLLRVEAGAGATIIISLHDLPYACRLADRLLLLGPDGLFADLPPARLDPAQVARLFQLDPDDAADLLGAARTSRPAVCAAE